MDKPMQPQEMWQWVNVVNADMQLVLWWTLINIVFSQVHNCYGDQLGLTSDDEDYIDPYENRDEETQQSLNNNGSCKSAADSVSEVIIIINIESKSLVFNLSNLSKIDVFKSQKSKYRK